jgi:hypothetical protein
LIREEIKLKSSDAASSRRKDFGKLSTEELKALAERFETVSLGDVEQMKNFVEMTETVNEMAKAVNLTLIGLLLASSLLEFEA